MCQVCGDPQCHYGEYCRPTGKSVRLTQEEQRVVQEALRSSVVVVRRGKVSRNSTMK